MLKIVTLAPAAGDAVLRLEGQIIGPWVDELRRTCDRLLSTTTVTLDLSDVSFVERRGVELLRTLGSRGVPLLHCSAFVTEQMKVQA
ncbi:MAG TPA: STAS domain-containing protein [Methylomirabilota bacterium]